MPSLAKKLYDEGLHDGLQEGIQKGMQVTVLSSKK